MLEKISNLYNTFLLKEKCTVVSDELGIYVLTDLHPKNIVPMLNEVFNMYPDISEIEVEASNLQVKSGQPFTFNSLVFVKENDTISCIAYINGKKSKKIENKWKFELSKYINFPQNLIYLTWTKGA